MMKRIISCTAAFAFCTLAIFAGESIFTEANYPAPHHPVPINKGLSQEWIDSLYNRGEKPVYTGEDLDYIGMPVGGIAAGQLYLMGDGTLADWQLFDHPISYMLGQSGSSFNANIFPRPVKQGFAVSVKNAGGKETVKTLSKSGFGQVVFNGQYPIGVVDYSEKGCPVAVRMQAFSPFIPLEAKDSALPATIFEITVSNTSKQDVSANVLGWLGNGVNYTVKNRADFSGKTVFSKEGDTTRLVHTYIPKVNEVEDPRPGILFADFDGADWNGWIADSTVFGEKPAAVDSDVGKEFEGAQGNGFACSKMFGVEPMGKLVSPEFTINRRYIDFLLVGGGNWDGNYVALVIDGEIVRRTRAFHGSQFQKRGWYVEEFEGQKARIELIDVQQFGDGYTCLDDIRFVDATDRDPRFWNGDGGMALACLDAKAEVGSARPALDSTFITSDAEYRMIEDPAALLSSKDMTLAPGESQTVRFAMSWFFPNIDHGRMYATRFADASAVADYVQDNYPRLAGDTKLWRDTYYDSTLPCWLLDRLHSTASILASGTTRWFENGRFYAFEGTTSCHGTCTHVWGYAQAHGRLFPELARNIRERQDFTPIKDGGGFFPDTGLVSFRGEINYGLAMDGQLDTILNAYREHRMSADNTFLDRNWPHIKKALQYVIDQDALGEKGGAASQELAWKGQETVDTYEKPTEAPNGVLEGTQHNTYDLNFFGENPLTGGLYLAALLAAEDMANDTGDGDFAKLCRSLYEQGRKALSENIFNGEYYIQNIDFEKDFAGQFGDGCLSDQLFGQTWAHNVGLGHILPEDQVRKTMQSIWKYNWTPDTGPYSKMYKPGRWFVLPEGQAGLLTTTWPDGSFKPGAMSYKSEIWSGIEYQVANEMIWEGMVTEGLSIVKGIDERYQPPVHNPYNEVECGDHYARAMASWGAYLALAGFNYHGPKGEISFAPKFMKDDYKAAFTLAEGWIQFAQKRDGKKQIDSIKVVRGKTRLGKLVFELLDPKAAGKVNVLVNGEKIKVASSVEDGKIIIVLEDKLELNKDDVLTVIVR